MRWDERFAGPVLQVRPVEDAPLLHECEDGHHWTEQPNGTVSPSYGLGGTEETWPDYNPKTCPEPDWHTRTDDPDPSFEGVECPGCGEVRLPCDLLHGLSSTPWLIAEEEKRTGHKHTAPLPTCKKPPVATSRWMEIKTTVYREVKGQHKKGIGWTAGWVPVDEAPALEGNQPPAQTSIFDEATRAKAREMLARQESQR